MLIEPLSCLVTGGAGFIGSHLVDCLLDNGHQVTVLDNLSTGRMSNLEKAQSRNKFKFYHVDIADFKEIRPLFKNIDWVFHCAALADIVPSIQTPQLYHHSNVDGTISVLEGARLADVKRFIYVASSSCYGIPEEYPTSETAPIQPMYPYALTKWMGEQYVLNWAKIYKMPCVSLRFFNVYGPRSRTTGAYGAVFGVFLAQKLAGKPFTVVGDGTQTRDFTFVTDVVDALVSAAKSNVKGEIFNVGSGNTYSVNELVGLIGGEVVYIPKRPGEPDCTFADMTKIKKALDWNPKVSFKEGVQTMLKNIGLWKDAPVWNESSIGEATKDWFKYLGN